jgi:hypothetical protein
MAKSLPRRIANRILGLLARVLPGALTLRPALHRLRGMQIGRGVWIGDDVYLENEYPELITLEDGAQVADFVAWFPGVTLEQVRAVLEHAARSLKVA